MNLPFSRLRSLAWLSASLLSAAASAAPDTTYKFVVMPPGSPGAQYTLPVAINNAGQVAGTTQNDETGSLLKQARVWQRDGSFWLDYVGDALNGDEAFGINDAGAVVGIAAVYPMLWLNGTAVALPGVPGHRKATGWAMDINNRGQIVGGAHYKFNKMVRPVVWDSATTAPRDLTPPFAKAGRATAINDKGTIVGWTTRLPNGRHTAVVWQDGKATKIGTLGGKSAEALAINNAGLVVGYSDTQALGGFQAFSWQNGKLQALAGPTGTMALAVNDHGDIVGFGTDGGGGSEPVAWLGGEYVRVYDLMPADALAAGWQISDAASINNAGVIVGPALNSITGVRAGYALVPQPKR